LLIWLWLALAGLVRTWILALPIVRHGAAKGRGTRGCENAQEQGRQEDRRFKLIMAVSSFCVAVSPTYSTCGGGRDQAQYGSGFARD